MATFKICIGNPKAHVYRWKELCDTVEGLFKPVIERSKKFNSVDAFSTMSKPALLPHDVIVYAWPSQVFKPVWAKWGDQNESLGEDQYGYTGWDKGGDHSASEIYIRDGNPKFLARMIFHEVLHYKTRLEGSALHNHSSRGLAKNGIDEETPLTDGNKQLMLKDLGRQRTAWLGPFDTHQKSNS